tara:strand:- start:3574 stop:4425 length:852 start_codon:yes stop_codon:yes gene_type:complete
MTLEMTRLSLILLIIFITGCAHRTASSESPTELDKIYIEVSRLSCELKYPNNKKYCECYANVINKITPDDLKNGTHETHLYKSRMEKVIKDSYRSLKRCNYLYKADLSIKKTKNSEILNRILAKHENEILSPSDVNSIDLNELSIGYEYAIRSTSLDKVERFRLTRANGSDYYFSLIDSDNSVKREDLLLYSDNVQYLNHGEDYRPRYPDRNCKFISGVCSYISAMQKTDEMNTLYENGVWIRNAPGLGKSRRIEKHVYDKNGILLYYLNSSGERGYERYRVE